MSPALRVDRIISLFGQEGETDITYWHELETGSTGRRQTGRRNRAGA
jgi:hypothetical protein